MAQTERALNEHSASVSNVSTLSCCTCPVRRPTHISVRTCPLAFLFTSSSTALTPL